MAKNTCMQGRKVVGRCSRARGADLQARSTDKKPGGHPASRSGARPIGATRARRPAAVVTRRDLHAATISALYQGPRSADRGAAAAASCAVSGMPGATAACGCAQNAVSAPLDGLMQTAMRCAPHQPPYPARLAEQTARGSLDLSEAPQASGAASCPISAARHYISPAHRPARPTKRRCCLHRHPHASPLAHLLLPRSLKRPNRLLLSI